MRNVSYITLGAFLLALWIVSMSYSSHLKNNGFDYSSFKAKAGDRISWSDAHYDDSSWSFEFPQNVEEKIWWMRFSMNIPQPLEAGKKYGLRLSVSAPYEVYFDGKLLGNNGQILKQTALADIKYQKLYFIPDTLVQQGKHKVAIRLAFNEAAKNFKVAIGEYVDLAREPLILSVFIHILAGIYLSLSLIFLFQAYAQGFRVDLLLGALWAGTLLLLLVFEYLKFYYDYSYQFQLLRIQIIEYLSFLLAILGPLFFLFRYKLPFKLILGSGLMLLLVSLLIFVEGYDRTAKSLILLSSLFSLAIVLYAFFKAGKTDPSLILSILVCILSFFFYYDISLFFGYGMLISSIALAYLGESIEEKRQYQQALLKSKRLEVELLKKNIQPHFLLNSLISLIDVIEEEPQEAVPFIQALANLSELVHEISSKNSIPLAKELALCEAYLTLMSYRKEIKYALIRQNLNLQAPIPPAIFLTILENGISHNKAIDGKMEFCISFCEDDKRQKYRIVSSGKPRKHQHELVDGIGNKYIKARLDEFCKRGNWSFQSQKDEQGWQTEILLMKPTS